MINLIKLIERLKALKEVSIGEEKLELIDTIYQLELKLSEMATSSLDAIDMVDMYFQHTIFTIIL